MQKLVFDPYTPPKLAYTQKVKCAYPNCQCDAINSHLLQKNRWLKQIAEDGRVLQMGDEQEQSLLDGDENGNVYAELSINKAMSLPIFCAQHDQKVFKDCEVKELDLSNKLHLLKLSYRAFCAAMAQEKRRNITNKNSNKVILDWLVMTNNWCVSPSYFGKEKETICEEIMLRKMEYQAQIYN